MVETDKSVKIERVVLLAPRMEARGTSAYTLHLAQELRHLGVEVTVFCVPGPMLPVLEAAGIPVQTFRHLESPWLHWRRRKALLAAVQDCRPQIIHAQSVRVSEVARFLVGRVDVPLVLTVHWLPRHHRRFRRLAKRLSGVIATTHAARQEIVNHGGVDRARVRVIPGGICVHETDEQVVEQVLTSHTPAVGSLGPVEAGRGHDLFVCAAARLIVAGVKAEFVVAGTGSRIPQIRRQVRELGLERHMTIATDFATYDSVVEAMDVVVQSSQAAVSGLSILTAMGYGRPVVAFNTATACELVEDEKTGLIVPKGEVDALTAAIRRMLEQRDEARAFGRAGRLRAAEHFDIRPLVGETMDYYAGLLARAAEGGR
jgi:glycosyltransferase involved in cell wall biosynthesis